MPVETLLPVVFRSVLCGIDGSSADTVAAARQAAVLSHPHARLTLRRDGDDLLGDAAGHDLLVVAPPDAARCLDEPDLPCPVLVARPSASFPRRILVADQGDDASAGAVAVAAAIAARRGSDLAIAAPAAPDGADRARLEGQVALVRATTGRLPALIPLDGGVDAAVPGLAVELGCSLLVVGGHRRDLARAAPCSVLVV